MDETISNSVKQLRAYRDRYYEVAQYYFAANKRLYSSDFIYIAALNRSFALHRGFCDLIEAGNFTSAGPLIRLQLDNCLRVVALDYVADKGKFLVDVLSGKQISKMRSASGDFLTDKYLRRQIAVQHPWINSLYEHASGFVHLSEKHIIASLELDSTQQGGIKFYISDRDPFVPPEAYLDAISAFAQATELFFAIVRSWADEIRSRRDDQYTDTG